MDLKVALVSINAVHSRHLCIGNLNKNISKLLSLIYAAILSSTGGIMQQCQTNSTKHANVTGLIWKV